MPRGLNMRIVTPLRAIRAHCMECQGESPKAVRDCGTESCHLWRYRLGHNPKRAGVGGRRSESGKGHSSTDSQRRTPTSLT